MKYTSYFQTNILLSTPSHSQVNNQIYWIGAERNGRDMFSCHQQRDLSVLNSYSICWIHLWYITNSVLIYTNSPRAEIDSELLLSCLFYEKRKVISIGIFTCKHSKSVHFLHKSNSDVQGSSEFYSNIPLSFCLPEMLVWQESALASVTSGLQDNMAEITGPSTPDRKWTPAQSKPFHWPGPPNPCWPWL